VNKDEYIRTLE